MPALAQYEAPRPKGMAPHEWDLVPAYRQNVAEHPRGINEPPGLPVRTMAEWEEVATLCITWRDYPVILKQIVRHAKDEVDVLIHCTGGGTSSVQNVTAYLMADNAGGPPLPDLDRITFKVASTNSVWIRDYGPETMYLNEVDSLVLLDWIYNRPRPADDALSDVIADHLGIPLFSTTQAPDDIVHTGGNFMADGFGTAFSSRLVDTENGPQGNFNLTNKSPAQVNALMDTWMGVDPYVKMETLPYDAIHHIDMHMKLLDEETLLVGEFPLGQSDGPQIEENIAFVQDGHLSTFGTPYKVVRIPMVPSTGGAYPPNASYRTYANAIFLNKLILVPTYREQFDTTGLRLWQEYMPGYNVVGIDCDNSNANIIAASGAIHCITKAIGVDGPLLIKHQPLADTEETVEPYAVQGWFRHRSGIAAARLYWTTDTAQAFNAVEMTDQGDHIWAAAIPAQPAGTEVFYYLEGEANDGKQQVRPIVAPAGTWRFMVLGSPLGVPDAAAPVIADVYPNPAVSVVVVDLADPGRTPVRMRLVDMAGRDVRPVFAGRPPADGRLFLDLSGLPAGSYTLVLDSDHGRSAHRLMKL
jgi:agmatine/peptidylarginine deiminase